MKHDKHKAKRAAGYKKKHGIPTGKSGNKAGKSTESAPSKELHQRKPAPEHGTSSPTATVTGTNALQLQADNSLIIEKVQKHHEMQKEYSRRKIESNWTKYVDFTVDDQRETEVCSEPRGEDFQKLVSKSDDAASQLRMKDEVWWDEDDEQDETETEIGKLFKVDFVDVARRLAAIPLHERLGISTKYFDDDLVKKINEDAAEHAKRYQDILDTDNTQDLDTSASSDITNNQTSREPSEPTLSASNNSCELDRVQEEADTDSHEQTCDDAPRTDSDREHCTTDLELTESQVTDVRSPATAASDSSCSHLSMSSSTSSGAPATSSNKTTLSADVNEPAAESQTKPDEKENLEEWLDDILDD